MRTAALAPGVEAKPFAGTSFESRGLASSAIVLLALFIALLAASSLLNDPDTQWHIAVGRWIWSAGRVPSTDVFSYTFEGAPWIAKEWGSQLILFAAYQAGGWRGVATLAALAIACSFALLHAWLRQRVRSTAALGLTLVAVMLAAPHFLARPHILVLPIIVLWSLALVSSLERDEAPAIPLALLMTLWANMHGSFPLGLVVACVLAGEGVLHAPAVARLKRLRQWGLFLAAALAATTLSPYGWRVILVPLRMSGNAATLRYVNEWQPLALDVTGYAALASLAFVLAVLFRRPRAELFRIVATTLLACLMIRHSRFISLFGIIAPILAAQAIARCRGLEPEPRGGAPRVQAGLVCALSAAAALMVSLIRPAPAVGMTPDAAFEAAKAAGVSGPVYNDYDFGGFLIAHGVKTFVDGRTDQLFLGDFLPALTQAVSAPSDTAFAALLRRYSATWALVRTHSDDAAHLGRLPGWTKIHEDAVASVYVARIERRSGWTGANPASDDSLPAVRLPNQPIGAFRIQR